MQLTCHLCSSQRSFLLQVRSTSTWYTWHHLHLVHLIYILHLVHLADTCHQEQGPPKDRGQGRRGEQGRKVVERLVVGASTSTTVMVSSAPRPPTPVSQQQPLLPDTNPPAPEAIPVLKAETDSEEKMSPVEIELPEGAETRHLVAAQEQDPALAPAPDPTQPIHEPAPPVAPNEEPCLPP